MVMFSVVTALIRDGDAPPNIRECASASVATSGTG